MYYKDGMYLFSILVICSSISMPEAFDLHSLDYIDEIISFVTESSSDETAGQQLDQLKINNEKNYAKIINKYITKAPHLNVGEEEFKELEVLIKKIDKAWEQFGTKELTDDDKNELSDLPETLSQLYKIYLGDGVDQNLPARIAQDKRPLTCEFKSNEQLRLRRLHQSVILSELRGFILSLKSSEDVEKATARAILHSEEYILATKNGFRKTVDVYYRCDPPQHIRGQTFSEFLGLFQGVIVNDLHTNAGNGACAKSCDGVDFSRIDKCYVMRDAFDNRIEHCHIKPCNGILYDCADTGHTFICELDENSDRRFQWARLHGSNQILGESASSCEGKKSLIREGWHAFHFCYTCMCTCAEQDGNSTAIRTISLIPQVADIQNNMVITGVRFVNKYQMFHIQIEQGKLGPSGEIVPGTSKWKKLSRFIYESKDDGGFVMINKNGQRKLFNNLDFKFITYESRTINIDQLKTPKGEVMVGVTFVYNSETQAVELQILSWPFDYKTGKLEDPVDLEDEDADFDWINWQNTPRRSTEYDRKRRYLSLSLLNDPIKSTDENVQYSDPNEQLKIRATGFDLDMAQHTIPYIDLQPVALSDLKTPIGGLELIYRRQKGYGGFLGFKMRSSEFSNFFGTEMSQDDLDKYKNDFDEDIVIDVPIKSD